MKKLYCISIVLIVFSLFATQAHASKIYWFKALTGGAAGALDWQDGSTLSNADSALVVTNSGTYLYYLNATSGAAESSPSVIAPDSNPGNKRWILQAHYLKIASLQNVSISAPSAGQFFIYNGSGWTNDDVPIGSLSNVDTGAPAASDALVWNANLSSWVFGSVSASAGGNNTEIQINAGGSFGTDTDFTYATSSDTLNSPNASFTNVTIKGQNTDLRYASKSHASLHGAGGTDEVTAEGGDTQIQYNNSGSRAGSAKFTVNTTTGVLFASGGFTTGTSNTTTPHLQMGFDASPSSVAEGDLWRGEYASGFGLWYYDTSAINLLTASRFAQIRALATSSYVATTNNVSGDFRMLATGTMLDVGAYVDTASTGIFQLDILKNGASILSTPIYIDATEKTSQTAATAAVIGTSAFVGTDIFTASVSQLQGTHPRGLVWWLHSKTLSGELSIN